jgi:hypothetical protein
MRPVVVVEAQAGKLADANKLKLCHLYILMTLGPVMLRSGITEEPEASTISTVLVYADDLPKKFSKTRVILTLPTPRNRFGIVMIVFVS